MELFLYIAAFLTVISFIATIFIGRSQKNATPGEYDSGTKNNFIRMTLIYAVTFLLAIIGVTIFILSKI